MINSTLERQAKSTDELMHRLAEERDGKKNLMLLVLILFYLLALYVLLKLIHTQVVHRWAARLWHTPLSR
jgi:predicted nucleic acid-binding Zn ribbon protein